MEKSKLSIGTLLLMGGALFSMHFGGSSMIWPMTWGKESGSSVLVAFAGVYLTAIFFPLLGYIALARGEGTFYMISSRVSKKFASVFCGITILVLGPLFVIPRMSAAAWDAFLQVSGYEPPNFFPIAFFSIVYYALVYWFISNKSKTIDKLSKILLPILLLTVAGIFVKGFISPLSSQIGKAYSQPAFVYGFLEGYATMELPCALVFAVIIINDLRSKGIGDESISKNLIIVGIIGTGILTITHFCHMYLGSLTGDLFKDLQFSSLYAQVVLDLWGRVGGGVFNIGLLFAALTTAIGLTASTSEYFEETSNGNISYKKAAIATVILSAIVSVVGLKNIVKYSGPLLNIIYPPAITLTLYYSLVPNLIKKRKALRAMRYSVRTAFWWGMFEGLLGYLKIFGVESLALEKVYRFFPLARYGLGWILLVLVATTIGLVTKEVYRGAPLAKESNNDNKK